ncbi:two-component system sensor histidine kinase NtrB [Heliophilum fasciatum]|uniref:histidine kinase n=1 Tax=Heliophilum fasciatum TaxID=35700 RepID=A0A4R2RJH1_9FIRM|nr:ATP-binding protein [Heliophilum fasciatum]MCW2278197.1 PAS domain S-box-containing protein [Heliophilum fasciatum]TCP63982.1 PAS/PAC sensor signal transduction histidine kinase [Heliophilum fasciatum]
MNNTIKKWLFPKQITRRVYVNVVLVVVMHTLLLTGLVHIGFFKKERYERKLDMLSAIQQMESQYPARANEYITAYQAGKITKAELEWQMHRVLQPVANQFSELYPNIDFGYYSNDLQQIVAAAENSQSYIRVFAYSYKLPEPSREEADCLGTRDPRRLLGFDIQGETDTYRYNQFWDEPTMYALRPLYHDQQIVAYAWAAVHRSSINRAIILRTMEIVSVEFIFALTFLMAARRIYHQMKREIKGFVLTALGMSEAAKAVQKDKENVLPEIELLLEKVSADSQEIAKVSEQLSLETGQRVRAEEDMVHIFSLTNDVLCIIDESGIIRRHNPALERLLGLPEEQIVNHSLFEFISNREEEKNIEGSALVSGAFETLLQSRQGEQRLIAWNMVRSGENIYASGRDITEVRRIEREMARLDRLSLTAQTAAGIAHEIRNPLTAVRGYLQLLQLKQECAAAGSYFKIMIEEIDRANGIITEFLSLSRTQIADLRRGNLNRAIESIAPLMGANAGSLILELGDVPDVLFGEKEFRQVLLNLVKNGFEASGHDQKVTVRTFAEDDAVVLQVQDQGPGIPPDVLSKLGTPFFTTKDTGTGLGLAVCFNIIAAHGAELKIDTGKSGTTFAIRFPLIQQDD